MTKALILICLFVTLGPLAAENENVPPAENLQMLRKYDHERFYCYPNGWGGSPAAARKDLDRVMDIYRNRPGYFRHTYVRIVRVSKTQWEADGCVSFLCPDARVAAPNKGKLP